MGRKESKACKKKQQRRSGVAAAGMRCPAPIFAPLDPLYGLVLPGPSLGTG